MTEEIRYIANLQRQEEFDNKVTELKDELKRLEQENRALQAYKDINEDFKKAWDELNEKYKQLRSALEEIKDIIRADCKGCTAECDCDDDCTRYKIKTKINECLGE